MIVSSLMKALQENRAKLVSLERTSNKEIEGLVEEHSTLLEIMERIQDYWNVQSTEAKALAKEIGELKEDLATIKKTQEILESKVKGKRQDLAVKQKTLQDSKTTLDEVTDRILQMEAKLRSVKSELREKEEELSNKRNILESLREDHKDLMRDLERERLEIRDEYDMLVSKYHAIRFLVREHFIEAAEAKILKVLEGKSSINIDDLKRETSLTTYRIEKAVKLLTERGVLEFSSRSGEITVKRQILL
ncbi:MAG: hypothetical protein ACFFCO_04755 [Promethearchaeota archaeon]